MLAWLASYPRSGNTFCRLLLEKAVGIRSASAKSGPVKPNFGLSPVEYDSPEDLRARDDWVFLKTHGLPEPDPGPAIHLVRDGRDSLTSYAYHTLVYDHGLELESIDREKHAETVRNLILEQRSPYGTWSRNVEAWLARSAPTVQLRFEELVSSPVECIQRALSELDIPFTLSGEGPPEFTELNREAPRFFRRGKVGGWRSEFPAELLDLFWEHNGQTMERLGYEKH